MDLSPDEIETLYALMDRFNNVANENIRNINKLSKSNLEFNLSEILAEMDVLRENTLEFEDDVSNFLF